MKKQLYLLLTAVLMMGVGTAWATTAYVGTYDELSAAISVQAYASSLQKAEELAETLRSAVLDLVQLPEIAGVHVNAGPYNYTDTRTHRYRYQLVAQIYHY